MMNNVIANCSRNKREEKYCQSIFIGREYIYMRAIVLYIFIIHLRRRKFIDCLPLNIYWFKLFGS